MAAQKEDLNIIALVKGTELLFADSRRRDVMRVLGRYASNPELSFTWYDAAVLSQKIREQQPQIAKPDRLAWPTDNDA